MPKKKEIQKLVRDFIPRIIRKNGEISVTRTLEGTHFDAALRTKIIEDGYDLAEARTRDEILGEAADLAEVLHFLLAYHRISQKELFAMRRRRRRQRGGFRKRIFLESVQ